MTFGTVAKPAIRSMREGQHALQQVATRGHRRQICRIEEQERLAFGRQVARGDDAEAAPVIGSGGDNQMVARRHAQAVLPRQHGSGHAVLAKVIEDAARIECLLRDGSRR